MKILGCHIWIHDLGGAVVSCVSVSILQKDSRRSQEVSEGLRHRAQRALVHGLSLEESLPTICGLKWQLIEEVFLFFFLLFYNLSEAAFFTWMCVWRCPGTHTPAARMWLWTSSWLTSGSACDGICCERTFSWFKFSCGQALCMEFYGTRGLRGQPGTIF